MITLQPPACLLQGAPGAGKTDSIATLLAAGLEVFVIMTEPGGVESLLDGCARRNLPIDNLHWTSVMPATAGWSAMTDMARTIGSMGFMDIQNIKSGVGKDKTREPAMKFLNALANFKCERTGLEYGDTSTWNDTRALVWDSLSGLSLIAMDLTVGYKPAAHQGEWGVAMNFVEKLLLKGTSDRKCFFVVTAHVEKELSELTGVAQIMASTLGRKLAPKIPRFFSDVIYAKRGLKDGKPHFTWSTADSQADLKNRNLPVAAELPPDFMPVVQAYEKRVKMALGTSSAAASSSPSTPSPLAAKGAS